MGDAPAGVTARDGAAAATAVSRPLISMRISSVCLRVQSVARAAAASRPSNPARATALAGPIRWATAPAGQDAQALGGQQPGLGHRERAHPARGGQGRHERRGRHQLVGTARAGQDQEQDQDW
jgi:hypothetical protein